MEQVHYQQHTLSIGGSKKLTLLHSYWISQRKAILGLSIESSKKIEKSYRFLKSYVDQRVPIYGINTQFGDQVHLLDTYMNHDENLYYDSILARQNNLIKSHACGLGERAPIEVVRIAMALRAHCLAKGYSGVHPETIDVLLSFLNADVIPVVYRYGSIGASGDLVPLASIASALIGEEVEVWYEGCLTTAPKAILARGLKPLQPDIRDGLALINGTSFMTAIASLACYDLHRIFLQMLSAIGVVLESLLVINSAYHPLVHELKGHSGSNVINQFFNEFWKGSRLVTDLDELRKQSSRDHSSISPIKTVQDYYSLRSVPQGFGPFYENLQRASMWIEQEMNAVNDNPIIDYREKKIHHGANFMGYYITDACDILKMNIAQASTWIHALLANMVHPRKNHRLPANLVDDPSNINGFRPFQLLAAALAVQNRKLAQSHQSFMLPTEGDNQDVNSLGTHAAFDLKASVENLEHLTAILLLAGVQALELRGVNSASRKSKEIYEAIRNSFPPVKDRPMSAEIQDLVNYLRTQPFELPLLRNLLPHNRESENITLNVNI